MHRYRLRPRPVQSVSLVATLLVLLGSIRTTDASVYLSLSKQSQTTITTPEVMLQNGTAGTNTIYTNNTSGKVNTTAMQTLYTHQETTIVGELTCRLLKLESADLGGETRSVEADNTGRFLFGQWVYTLTDIQSIPASTWTFYYRVNKTYSAIEAHCDVNILIRMSNGTVRQTIATDVANSGAITLSYSTLSGTYSWADHTVVDETDYLEIDYYVDITAKRNNEYFNLRVDDNNLAEVNQTRVADIYLPNTYDYVLRANNTETDSWKIRLKKYSDSNIGRLQNCTIYFHNATDGTSSQLVIENGAFTTETGPWYDLEDSETIYVAMITQANSTGTSRISTYLEVLIPNTTTYVQYIITFEIS